MSKRATRGEWLERVRSWKASGQGLGEFAKDKEFSVQRWSAGHGSSASVARRWSRRKRRRRIVPAVLSQVVGG